MSDVFNIYCDESCHLENDCQKVMALGAIWCPMEKVRFISKGMRNIKIHHNLASDFEIKWTKVSPGKQRFYVDILDYFFNTDDLHFRVLIIPDKSILNHEKFDQTHDIWYYKMYFELLKVILIPNKSYNIYLDIKDTIGKYKMEKLHDILSNNICDYSREIIQKIQLVRSHEVALLQLADLLIGALVYINRGVYKSSAKKKLVEYLKEKTGYTLTKTTLLREDKFNILIWKASEGLRDQN